MQAAILMCSELEVLQREDEFSELLVSRKISKLLMSKIKEMVLEQSDHEY